jgi:hypothetical protein
MQMKVLALAVLLAFAACGPTSPPRSAATPSQSASAQTPAATSSAQPAQSPSTASAGLFAVASGIPGGQLINSSPPGTQATVEIVGPDGHVHAQASFAPPPAPLIGNAEPLLQSPVRTAAGAVFYADSTGAVHRLRPDGSTSVVATFPLTNAQQELSYAVSPDGAHLIAIVLSTPPLHNPPPQTLGDPLFQDGGHWTLKLETADSGGSTTTTLQRDLGTAYPQPTQIVGWDAKGPIATLNTNLGAQQSPLSAHLFGVPLIHIATDGTHLDSIGGPNCAATDMLSNGTVICTVNAPDSFAVRTTTGTTLWQGSVPSNNYYYGLWLSPDTNAVAVQYLVVTAAGAVSLPAQSTTGAGQLSALGWLDANTVVEATAAGQLSLYEAHGLTKIRDLGVSGLFEGLL